MRAAAQSSVPALLSSFPRGQTALPADGGCAGHRSLSSPTLRAASTKPTVSSGRPALSKRRLAQCPRCSPGGFQARVPGNTSSTPRASRQKRRQRRKKVLECTARDWPSRVGGLSLGLGGGASIQWARPRDWRSSGGGRSRCLLGGPGARAVPGAGRAAVGGEQRLSQPLCCGAEGARYGPPTRTPVFCSARFGWARLDSVGLGLRPRLPGLTRAGAAGAGSRVGPAPRRAVPAGLRLHARAAGAGAFMSPEDVREALQGS